MKNVLSLLGRLFLSSLFIVEVIKNFLTLNQATQSFIQNLNQWLSRFVVFPQLMQGLDFLIIHAETVCWVALIVAGLGAVLLFLGLAIRLSTFLLICMVIGSLLLKSPSWFSSPGLLQDWEIIEFFQQLAILGGLFLLFTDVKVARKEA